MPEYRNPVTGVVVRVPKETGDRLAGFQPVAHSPKESGEKPKRTTRRKKSE